MDDPEQMFRVELCYRFGVFPSELGKRLSVRDYVLLLAAEGIEPRGETRDDARAGVIAAAVSNPYRKRGAPPFKASDFFKSLRPRQSNATLKKQLMAYTIGLGGTVTEIKR